MRKKCSYSFWLKKIDFLKNQTPTFQWTVAEDKECALFLNRCKNNSNKRSSAFQANLTISKPGAWFFSYLMMTMPSLCCQIAKKAHSVSPNYHRNEQNQISLCSWDGVYVSRSDACLRRRRKGRRLSSNMSSCHHSSLAMHRAPLSSLSPKVSPHNTLLTRNDS